MATFVPVSTALVGTPLDGKCKINYHKLQSYVEGTCGLDYEIFGRTNLGMLC